MFFLGDLFNNSRANCQFKDNWIQDSEGEKVQQQAQILKSF